ncbi:MAG: SGNH/GDSL hydrolase family protein [Candidatus Nitronauta litoralis]|uniref:SGNH/GDSL hydrolase family protein n=1 Tax=Candidatus Nitronauta litoralis TaxID=2705533 RepID=A0A7T0BXN5_9BACT|nr:MAG: SGNH/GDSL hydrolase family protein [Candidatus Nitronauta litoralis]
MPTPKPSSEKSKPLSLKKKTVFILIPILFFLAGLEGILRLTVGLRQIRYKCHYPVLDNQYCPNIVAIKDKNGETIRSNSDGLLDKEYEKPPPPNTFRVAVLGDSFVAGEIVKDGFEFHAVLENKLTQRLNQPIEFINFGVNGIGTWKELQTYHLRARHYKPDLTLLVFYWGNDLDNSFSELKRGGPNPLKEEYPTQSFKEKVQVLRKRFNQWLWNNVALYQFTHTRYHLLERRFHQWFGPEWRQRPTQKNETETPALSQSVENPRINNQLLKKYPALDGITPRSTPLINEPTSLDDPWFFDSDAWNLVKKLILKIKQEVEEDEGKLIVMHFLGETQYMERHDLPVKEFNEFLEANKIGVIDPNPIFFRMSREELHSHYVPQDIHFNEDGQRLLAEHSVDFLERTIRKMINLQSESK